jgi:hypothetical protein
MECAAAAAAAGGEDAEGGCLRVFICVLMSFVFCVGSSRAQSIVSWSGWVDSTHRHISRI